MASVPRGCDSSIGNVAGAYYQFFNRLLFPHGVAGADVLTEIVPERGSVLSDAAINSVSSPRTCLWTSGKGALSRTLTCS